MGVGGGSGRTRRPASAGSKSGSDGPDVVAPLPDGAQHRQTALAGVTRRDGYDRVRRGGRASKKSGANCVPTGALRWVRTPHRRGRGAGAAGPVGACVAPDARANTGPHGQACAHHSDHCDPEGRGGPRKRPFFDHFRRPGPRQAAAPARPEAGWMWGDPRDAVPPRIAIGRRWNGGTSSPRRRGRQLRCRRRCRRRCL